jgi:ribonuclease G
MKNEIIINAEIGETRVALLEDRQFAELHIERERDKSVVGNVVKGKVSRVLPGMQAAFVDIGLEKAAFLYVGDYFESTLETGETEGEPGASRRRRGRGGRSAPPRIDTVLHEGKEIIVQIAKEPIGTKGARITSSISIPGRHLVLTPWSRRVGVSRRIGSDKERRRLREIVERLRPKNLGFIIRTAGDGVREADLEADIRYLATVWAAIQHRHAETNAPAMLYSEHDLPLRVVRDLAGHETKRIVVDDKPLYEHIQSFVDRFVAEPKPAVEFYDDPLPIFERHDLESQIHANLERKVWLKSGGSLVIDKSEALTSIDVNTGRFVGKRDLEETVLKTNLEAVQEVVHQLRFRNLGGLIIIDLIDMESGSNREKVYRALQEALRADKARTNILKISELGLVEMTRKRTRENLVQTLCEPCSYCEGRSYVLSRESVAFRVMREIRKRLPKLRERQIAIAVNPHVAEELLLRHKDAMGRISADIGKDVEIRARSGMHQEQYELTVLEPGPPAELELDWLNETHPDARKESERGAETEGNGGGRRRRGRGRGRRDDEERAERDDSDGEDESQAPSQGDGKDEAAAGSGDLPATLGGDGGADAPGEVEEPPDTDAERAAAIYARLDAGELDVIPTGAHPEAEPERRPSGLEPAEASAIPAGPSSLAPTRGTEIQALASTEPERASGSEPRPGPGPSVEAAEALEAAESSAGTSTQAVDAEEESSIIRRSD